MGPIVVRKMCPTQCEIMVGESRVGYVCFGKRMPINLLNKSTSGLELTEEEQIQLAKEVRRQMAKLNEKKEASSNELATLLSADYEGEESEDADEGTDTRIPV